jgi:hypothetical protein
MTPKEKANELFDKMFLIIENKGMYDDLYRAKECALIAVDEILSIIWWSYDNDKFFWQDVKQEIEAL